MNLVPFMLQGSADHWWSLVTRTEDVGAMTWAQFTTLFMEQYYPQMKRDARREEFMWLY